MTRVTRRSWMTEAMPEEREPLEVSRRYSQEGTTRLQNGLLPARMEDKWFGYYEEPWMYFHRSWTGHFVFRARFEPAEEGVVVARAEVNRAPGQYRDPGDERLMLEMLLDVAAGRNIDRQWLDYVRTMKERP